MQGEESRVGLCAPGGARVMASIVALLPNGQGVGQGPEYGGLAQPNFKPNLVKVREADCIGCTLCLQACPTAAIVGAAKQVHTVITDDCSGCGLCVPVCPVDCIDAMAPPVGHRLTVQDGDGSLSRDASLQVWQLVRAKQARQGQGVRAVTSAREIGEVPDIVPVGGDLAAKIAAARGRARVKYTTKVKPVLPKLLQKKKAKSVL